MRRASHRLVAGMKIAVIGKGKVGDDKVALRIAR
jgi:hypothetical protein